MELQRGTLMSSKLRFPKRGHSSKVQSFSGALAVIVFVVLVVLWGISSPGIVAGHVFLSGGPVADWSDGSTRTFLIEGAAVTVTPVENDSGAVSVVTTGDGLFAVRLSPGVYDVSAIYPSGGERLGPERVTVTPFGIANVDIGLMAP
jgi:hypothetical protein